MGNMGLVVLEEFIHDRQTDRIAGYYIDDDLFFSSILRYKDIKI